MNDDDPEPGMEWQPHPAGPAGQAPLPLLVQQPPLPLEDLEEWVRRNGLEYSEDLVGQGSVLNQQEAHARFDAFRHYETQVHERLFHDELQQEDAIRRQKQAQLQVWKHNQVQIHVVVASSRSGSSSSATTSTRATAATDTTGTTTVHMVPLHQLAAHSDTVYAMATTPDKALSVASTSSSLIGNNDNHDMDEKEDETKKLLTLTLEQYSPLAVQTFLKVIEAIQSQPAAAAAAGGGGGDDGEGKQHDATAQHWNRTVRRIIMSHIPDDHLVECCQMAHYLQCTCILQELVHACLIPSVDTANCLSLVQLADQLELPDLMEASLSHMMASLTHLEQHEIWDDLCPELQQRIGTIQTILEQQHQKQRQQQLHKRRRIDSSGCSAAPNNNHNNNSSSLQKPPTAKLYFTSFQEYLAIFAEQVEYYRERLHDAKVCQQGHLIEDENDNRRGGGGRSSPAWIYAQTKIDQHERRVQTLREVLAQQKQLFGATSAAAAPESSSSPS
jgi:hypothetical protein